MEKVKPAIKSWSIWGGLIAIVPLVLEALPELATQVVPVLPPHVGAVVSAVGGVLAIIGRKTAKKKVQGIF